MSTTSSQDQTVTAEDTLALEELALELDLAQEEGAWSDSSIEFSSVATPTITSESGSNDSD